MGTWADGLIVWSPRGKSHELTGQRVSGLSADGHGGALAIVGQRSLSRRSVDGVWTTLAKADTDLSCCLMAGGEILVGTDEARLLRLVAGRLEPISSLDAVDGRETWFAGTAVVDGRVLGPPLGVRSMDASPEGERLHVNVHVGGIPRSSDAGATWHPTIDVMADVHEVRVHPHRPEVVAAAGAAGLWMSDDGGLHWRVETEGLHGEYCSAVAFVGEDILVAASEHHFASSGAVYRRPIDERGALTRVDASESGWLHGIADTHCLVANGDAVAIADGESTLRFSSDAGHHWTVCATGLPQASSALIL